MSNNGGKPRSVFSKSIGDQDCLEPVLPMYEEGHPPGALLSEAILEENLGRETLQVPYPGRILPGLPQDFHLTSLDQDSFPSPV